MRIDYSSLYCSSCWGIVVLQLSSEAAIIQPEPLAKVSSLVYYQHKSFNCCSPAGPWSGRAVFPLEPGILSPSACANIPVIKESPSGRSSSGEHVPGHTHTLQQVLEVQASKES